MTYFVFNVAILTIDAVDDWFDFGYTLLIHVFIDRAIYVCRFRATDYLTISRLSNMTKYISI